MKTGVWPHERKLLSIAFTKIHGREKADQRTLLSLTGKVAFRVVGYFMLDICSNDNSKDSRKLQ